MNAIEVVEIAKKVNSEVNEDVFFRALERLEKDIAKRAQIENYVFDKEEPLIAAGNVYDGYDDLYTFYLKREAALCIEDKEWLANYDALFLQRWSELLKEIVRTHKPENQSFPDWRWT